LTHVCSILGTHRRFDHLLPKAFPIRVADGTKTDFLGVNNKWFDAMEKPVVSTQ
jgi:hypothetical protein